MLRGEKVAACPNETRLDYEEAPQHSGAFCGDACSHSENISLKSIFGGVLCHWIPHCVASDGSRQLPLSSDLDNIWYVAAPTSVLPASEN